MSGFSVVEAAREYVSWDPNSETSSYINSLIEEGKEVELEKLLGSRLAFGTAGLRGPMGPGYNRMNDIVILQTTQGLARYLEAQLPADAKSRGIVIGYDHRRLGTLSSLGFARMSAAVFLSQGFKVYLLEGLVPTPFVAFGVPYLGCAAGIMVTASHNPKQDNGFKVYWGNGSQIIPPHDSGIAQAILDNLAPWQDYDLNAVTSHPLAEDVTARLAEAYYSRILSVCRYKQLNGSSPLRVAYTAMHGVGCQWTTRSFQTFGHPALLPVPSQREPDAAFPTVSFPNPEEKGALNESMQFADSQGCTLIIANDPDADRLAAAEKSGDSWNVFTGNEIGVLLGHWQIAEWKRAGGGGATPAVLASVVSSRMLKAIALAEGVKYYDTLTGFKWLGNRSLQLRSEGTPVLFAYEEALGYCVGDVVSDKDGVLAAPVFYEMASFLHREGLTVKGHLQRLAQKYGEFVSYNSYVICHDPRKTDRIFERLRTGGPSGGYWTHCVGQRIVTLKDITKGYDSTASDGKSDLPLTPNSHMLMYEFENGCSVTLRTSGTEPKIKFYTEIAGDPSKGQSRADLEKILKAFVDNLVNEMLQPDENGLIRA